MERTYYLRGERRTLEEVEDVVPVKSPVSADAREALGTGIRADELGLPEDTFEAFRRADWVFVSPPAGIDRLAPERGQAWPAQLAGKLVRRQDGRFGIVTRRLVVQLHEDIPEAEAVIREVSAGVLALAAEVVDQTGRDGHDVVEQHIPSAPAGQDPGA